MRGCKNPLDLSPALGEFGGNTARQTNQYRQVGRSYPHKHIPAYVHTWMNRTKTNSHTSKHINIHAHTLYAYRQIYV